MIDRAYHAVLKDHPELFWIHNREVVYGPRIRERITACFRPIYLYGPEVQEIQAAMEQDIRNDCNDTGKCR